MCVVVRAGENYPWLVQLPVSVVSMDFLGAPGAAVGNRTLELVARHGFPAGKVLGAGVIDGRSVWADTGAAPALVAALVSLGVSPGLIRVQSSVSLQVRHTLEPTRIFWSPAVAPIPAVVLSRPPYLRVLSVRSMCVAHLRIASMLHDGTCSSQKHESCQKWLGAL